jgi:hypothetical protein
MNLTKIEDLEPARHVTPQDDEVIADSIRLVAAMRLVKPRSRCYGLCGGSRIARHASIRARLIG